MVVEKEYSCLPNACNDICLGSWSRCSSVYVAWPYSFKVRSTCNTDPTPWPHCWRNQWKRDALDVPYPKTVTYTTEGLLMFIMSGVRDCPDSRYSNGQSIPSCVHSRLWKSLDPGNGDGWPEKRRRKMFFYIIDTCSCSVGGDANRPLWASMVPFPAVNNCSQDLNSFVHTTTTALFFWYAMDERLAGFNVGETYEIVDIIG